jgi:Domain of unknown function (DUF2828)
MTTATFAHAVQTQPTTTTNGMKAFAGTGNACVNLFYAAGAMRGKDILPLFKAAYAENTELTLRIVQWVRDVRGGAGERQIFKDILAHLEITNQDDQVRALIDKISEIGRADDMLINWKTAEIRNYAFATYGNQLRKGNGLFYKYLPREKSAKKKLAAELRSFFGLTPRQYRKLASANTNVTESQMCAKDWDNINFSHVPSVAASRYKKAFKRNAPVAFTEYVEKLTKGDPSVKVNSSAIFPYTVIKGWQSSRIDPTIRAHVNAQWSALPNYVGDASILPLVDVSGSMSCPAGGDTSVTCHDVALSLGLYLSEKNTGKFKDMFLTFSDDPQLLHLTGDVMDRLEAMDRSKWDMSTDLVKALAKILEVAVAGNVPQGEMPEILCVMSDMQFNEAAEANHSAMESVRAQYAAANYKCPKLVWWNLNHTGNVPVTANEQGAALVSGFSPSVVKSILSADPDDFTPLGIMLATVMVPRYDTK